MSKTVLITGASSGFGEATARLLSEKGFNLILVARRTGKLEKIAKSLSTQVHTEQVDVTNRELVGEFIKNLPDEFSEIDVLVNNAGLASGLDTADTADYEDWDKMIDTNIKGLLNMTREVLPGMKERNRGHVVNIGSVSSIVPYKGGNVYGGTKAFVNQFTRNLRTDFLGSKLRFTDIKPGIAETEFSIVRFGGDKGKAKTVYEGTEPLKADDIAEAVLWAITRPEHVNIDNIEIMPTRQTSAGLATDRG